HLGVGSSASHPPQFLRLKEEVVNDASKARKWRQAVRNLWADCVAVHCLLPFLVGWSGEQWVLR
ncbi:hypothetical protein CMV_030674, partial [Castanea mollissima]